MELSLKEEFFLLVYDDLKGRPVISGNKFLYSIAGAVLLELAHKGKISVREKYVYVNCYKSSGDIVLDQIMEQIRKSPKNKKIKYWVNKLGRKGNTLRKDILAKMVSDSIYRKEDYKVMGLFNCSRYYNRKPGYKEELEKNILRMVFEDHGINEKLFMLVSLIGTSGLVRKMYTCPLERRYAKRKIKEMTKKSDFGSAINEVIASTNAAIITAIATSAAVTPGS